MPAARLNPPALSDLSDRQRAVHDTIAAGPRGVVQGPLALWLHRPELASTAQALGQYCRYDSSLEPRLSELAIMTIAAIWKAEFEWGAHLQPARAAGLSEAVLQALLQGKTPEFAKRDEALVHAITRAAHLDRAVPDDLYAEGMQVLGRDRMVDLVGVLGYYSLISLTLNIFRVPPPEGQPPVFGD